MYKDNYKKSVSSLIQSFLIKKRKAISPLIATILLIVVAVAIIVIVLSWGKAFTSDSFENTTNVTSFKTSDATHFVFRPEIKNTILTFTYSPPASLKNKEIIVDSFSVLGYEEIIELDEPVTLIEGITAIKDFDLSSLEIQERNITIVLYTTNNEIINLTNIIYRINPCSTGLNNGIYILCYADDFDYVRDNLDGDYALGRNIDFFNPNHWQDPPLNISTTTDNWNSGEGFESIGSAQSENFFTGTFDGRGYTLTNLYINKPSGNDFYGLFSGIAGANLSNIGLVDVNLNLVGGAALVGVAQDSNISYSFATGEIYRDTGSTIYISKLNSENSFKEVYSKSFSINYETQEFLFEDLEEILTLRINQKNLPFSGVDAIILNACEEKLTPTYAHYTDTFENVLEDVLKIDKNIAVVNNKTIEVSWNIPEECSTATLFLTANEYGNSFPLRFPLFKGSVEYTLRSNFSSLEVDGILEEVINEEPLYSFKWSPSTGHPITENYIYVRDDLEFIYFSVDIPSDNTNDFGEDWIEITINENKFLVNDFDNTYGVCGFGMTDKADYKHQTCEIKIPKSEIEINEVLEFSLRYYGTAGYNILGGLVTVFMGNNTYLYNSYSSVNVTSPFSMTGGLVSALVDGASVYNSYSTGEIYSDYSYVGGLIGYTEDGVNIVQTYSTANVEGDDYVGGLIGFLGYYEESQNFVLHSYSVGSVTGDLNVGGLLGGNPEEIYVEIIDCYYDSQTSGQSDEDKGIPKTTSEMKQEATFIGWDFTNIWQITENVTYPLFKTPFPELEVIEPFIP